MGVARKLSYSLSGVHMVQSEGEVLRIAAGFEV